MKNKLLFSAAIMISSLAAGTHLSAQNVATVYNQYVLYPASDSVNANQLFYTGKVVSGFGPKELAGLKTISVQHTFYLFKTGQRPVNYRTAMAFDYFFGSHLLVTDCAHLSRASFDKPLLEIDPVQEYNPGDTFSLRKNNLVSDAATLYPGGQVLIGVDTIQNYDPSNDSYVTMPVHYYLDSSTSALQFYEKWNFDAGNGSFRKVVSCTAFLKQSSDGYGAGFYGPALTVMNDDTSSINKKDMLLEKDVITDEAVNYAEMRIYNDTAWRGADDVALMNASSGNIPLQSRMQLLAAVFSWALQHPEQVSPMKDDGPDTRHPFRSTKDLLGKFSWVDSSAVYYAGDDMTPSYTHYDVTLSDVYAIRFYEDWYYDPKTFAVKKKVKGIGFIVRDVKSSDNFRLKDAGIYVKVN